MRSPQSLERGHPAEGPCLLRFLESVVQDSVCARGTRAAASSPVAVSVTLSGTRSFVFGLLFRPPSFLFFLSLSVKQAWFQRPREEALADEHGLKVWKKPWGADHGLAGSGEPWSAWG